ncbi:MAG: TetR/AcrR family transcriptional regulator [Gaiellaceae bacterium]
MSEFAAPLPTNVDGKELTRRGAATRARLLEAAEETFADLGYHEASIVKITEVAGVAQGTFYLYFASKQEIFEELVRDLNRRVRRAMAEGAAKGKTRVEAEVLGFEGFFEFTAEHAALYRIIRQAEFVSPETLRGHYEAIADGYVSGLQAAMAEGEVAPMDPTVLAWALMGMGELIGMRWILWDGAPSVPKHVLAELRTLVERVLGA